MNFRLRLAIDKARAMNMPNANIDRAVAAGSGEGKGGVSKEALYEGFGPGRVALMIEAVTDNPNRTSAEIRSLLSKAGGSLGAQHSVGWMFSLHGVIHLAAAAVPAGQREAIELEAIDAGADDVRDDSEEILILTPPEKLQSVKNILESKKMPINDAKLEFVPTTTVSVNEAERQALFALFETLDNHADVTGFFSNDA